MPTHCFPPLPPVSPCPAAPFLLSSLQFFCQHIIARSLLVTGLVKRRSDGSQSWREYARKGEGAPPAQGAMLDGPSLSTFAPGRGSGGGSKATARTGGSCLQGREGVERASPVLQLGPKEQQAPPLLLPASAASPGRSAAPAPLAAGAAAQRGVRGCTPAPAPRPAIPPSAASPAALHRSRPQWRGHGPRHRPVQLLPCLHHPLLLCDVQVDHAPLPAGLCHRLGHREAQLVRGWAGLGWAPASLLGVTASGDLAPGGRSLRQRPAGDAPRPPPAHRGHKGCCCLARGQRTAVASSCAAQQALNRPHALCRSLAAVVSVISAGLLLLVYGETKFHLVSRGHGPGSEACQEGCIWAAKFLVRRAEVHVRRCPMANLNAWLPPKAHRPCLLPHLPPGRLHSGYVSCHAGGPAVDDHASAAAGHPGAR